jgi:DNA repair ATPase RecN
VIKIGDFIAKSGEIYGLSERLKHLSTNLNSMVDELINQLNTLEWRPKEFRNQYEHLNGTIDMYRKLIIRIDEAVEDIKKFSENVEKIDAKEYDDFLKKQLTNASFNEIVDSFR